MSPLSHVLKTVALIVVTCTAIPTSAQRANTASHDAAVSEAHVHFERGVELYREGSLDAALAEFERSHQLVPNYKILYNLAQVQAERHEYVAAIELMTRYLQAGGDDISAERKRAVTEDLGKLRDRIAALTIQVDVDGAAVFVNDAAVGSSPLPEPVLVNVGTCRVRVEKAGYLPKTETITVAGADRRSVTLQLVRAPALARGARVTTVRENDMTPFWISLGATVVLGGTTAVVGGMALSANHDLDQSLNRLPASRDSVDSARHKLRTMAALTDGFGAATAVAAGSALYFLIFPPEHTEVISAGGVHAALAPTPNGLSVAGVF